MNKTLRLSIPIILSILALGASAPVAFAAAAVVTNVTSSTVNGSYKAGQVISIQVTFDKSVTVTGTPQLTLSTGNPATTAVNYTSGSGNTTLTFDYTVATGNTSSDLDYASTGSLTGTISATGGTPVLTLFTPGATGSLGANKNIVIDTTAPTNENTVFAASVSKMGGASVAIVSSGDTTNNVWLAPSGTTVFVAGSTMTKASNGLATTILAPATAGIYKLFVLDAAGNISTASTATLTVDNTAPTFVSAQTKTTTTIEATFSEDLNGSTVNGTGTEFTVAGFVVSAASETSPGVVTLTVATMPTNATPNVTFTNIDNFKDLAGNQAVTPTTRAATDGIAPVLTSVHIASDNTNTAFAKVGNTVIVSFTSSEAIQTPTATIDGQTATVENPSGNNWTAPYIMTSSEATGAVSFNIAFSDLVSNTGVAVTAVTDASSVTFDKIAPVITRLGDATVNLTAGDPSYNDAGATASDNIGGDLTFNIASVNPVNVNVVGPYTVTYNVSDAAGNPAAEVTRTVIVNPNYTTIFGDIKTALVAQGITTNLDGCASTPTACSGLYFEKTDYGRVTFNASLDLTDSAINTFLQSLGSYMEAGAGSMSFDARTAEQLRTAGAEIKMYGFPHGDGIGDVTQSELVVKDDTDSEIASTSPEYPTISNFAWDNSTGTVTFGIDHFTQFFLNDTIKPFIVSFDVPATSDSLTVSGITVTAHDNRGVAGLMFSELETPPDKNDIMWSSETPSTYTFDSEGTKTLYAWAKDAVDNISNVYEGKAVTIALAPAPPALTTITIDPLTVELTVGNSTRQLAATTLDQYGAPIEAVITWVSSDETIATVDVSGVVTPVGEGTTNITVSSGDITSIDPSVVTVTTVPIPDDTTPPTIDPFSIPETHDSLIVPVSDFTAHDDVLVTGYLLTEISETPDVSDPNWSDTPQTEYTFDSEGGKTLYAWARDAIGNISSSSSGSVMITLPLVPDTTPPTVTTLGDGGSDYSLPSLRESLFGVTMSFSEKLDSIGRTAVENALATGADKELTFKWNDNNGGDGSKLRISVSGDQTATFANDVTVDGTDLAGNTANGLLLIDSTAIEIVFSSAKAMTAFSFPSGTGVINETDHTIAVAVPHDAAVTALVATFTTTGTSVSVGEIVQTSATTENDFISPETYTITAEDGSIQEYVVTVTVLAATQTTPTTAEDGSGDATIDAEKPEVVITNPDQDVDVTIESGTTDPKIDVSSFVSNGTGDIPKITITSTAGTGNAAAATITIPATTVTGPSDWNGVIAAPTVTTVTLPAISGQTKTVSTAIEVGLASAKLSFDKAVKILLPNQAGKRAGYTRPGTDFTEITDTCSTDSQAAGDALAVDSECKIDVGSDLVIWTKHFTTFAAYTQTTTPTPTPVVSSNRSGGGRRVTAAIAVIAPAVNPAPTTPTTPAQGKVLGAAVYHFAKSFTTGSRGAEVTALQQYLVDSGYKLPSGVTSYFGKETTMAVMAFQKAKGIAQIGIVGPLTRAELNKGVVATTSETTTNSDQIAAAASGFTTVQTNSIIAILQALGVDQTIMDNVRAVLAK